jgi:hypothetical protein
LLNRILSFSAQLFRALFYLKAPGGKQMYAGYTATTEQDRARWELMKANAQRRAQAQADANRKPAEIKTA